MLNDLAGNGVEPLNQLKFYFSFIWRLFATDFSFSVFGAGALLIAFVIFPLIHILALFFSLGKEWAYRRCRFVIHIAFKVFANLMSFLGIITYEFHGAEKLKGLNGTLVVANHPSLIDVVYIISMIPQTQCVVKKGAWSNPFLMGVMWGTGYIQNSDPMQLVDDCVAELNAGNNLVIFPEATRTVRGKPMKLKRGAASIISKYPEPFIPITITCNPPTLSKQDKWFLPPLHPSHFILKVHDLYDPKPGLVDIDQLSLSNRHINRVLIELFTAGIKLHERFN